MTTQTNATNTVDGHTLAAGVTDGTVWLWDISNHRLPRAMATLGPVGDPIYSVGFSPGGDVLVTSGARSAELLDFGTGTFREITGRFPARTAGGATCSP
jgi:WD40 repeat protein